jgi:hypothetical protein
MARSAPTISVLIPLYNKEAWVARCLESIRAQTFTDYEIIVVDDGSTDDGAATAKRYLAARDQFITQANAGPGAARNRGIAVARGQYLAFIDADDEWVPEFLARAAGAFAVLHKSVEVVSQARTVAPGGFVVGPRRWQARRALRLGPGCPLRAAFDTIGLLGTGRIAVKRSALARLGGFYDQGRALIGEDTWLWLKLAFGCAIYADPRVGMVNHTDAGDLWKGGRAQVPYGFVEPHFTHFGTLREACDPSLHQVLDRVHLSLLLERAASLTLYGDWRLSGTLWRPLTGCQCRRGASSIRWLCTTRMLAGVGKPANSSRGPARLATDRDVVPYSLPQHGFQASLTGSFSGACARVLFSGVRGHGPRHRLVDTPRSRAPCAQMLTSSSADASSQCER